MSINRHELIAPPHQYVNLYNYRIKNMEDIAPIVGSVIALCAGILGIYKLLVQVIISKSQKRRDEYSFSKEFLADLENPETHALTLQKGFHALTGISASLVEIKHILAQPNPDGLIRSRSSAKEFIDFCPASVTYKWKSLYAISWIRKCTSGFFLSLYFIFGVSALTPLLTPQIDIAQFLKLPVTAFVLSFGLVALFSLVHREDFKEARKFMALQEQAE